MKYEGPGKGKVKNYFQISSLSNGGNDDIYLKYDFQIHYFALPYSYILTLLAQFYHSYINENQMKIYTLKKIISVL